jgi:hypothetical protein
MRELSEEEEQEVGEVLEAVGAAAAAGAGRPANGERRSSMTSGGFAMQICRPHARRHT